MRLKWIKTGALLLASAPVLAQERPDSSFAAWKRNYYAEFLTDPRSPLRAADTGFIEFYPFNTAQVYSQCWVEYTPQAKVIVMATHSGEKRRYQPYAILHCAPQRGAGTDQPSFQVRVYRSTARNQDSTLSDHLFLPFFDRTNGEATYGGGRYIDLKRSDIRQDRITVDFNRAYNPWCAFSDGYSCPIPPDENRLPVAIEAGERQFTKHRDE